MRQRNMMTGFDMEQHSHPNIPPMNPLPTLEPYDNNSMFNGLPHFPPPHPSNLGPGMSTPPSLYLPYAPFHAPPPHPLAPGSHDASVHESNPHFMGNGYKRKSSEAIPGNYQHLIESQASCSFPPETAPFSFPPHYATTTTYPQPVDQRSVRSRVGGAVTLDPPPYSHVNYGPHPFPPPVPNWYDQHVNDNTSDGSSSSSFWLQPPSVPFMHGNVGTGSMDSGNACLPRFHEASSSRNDIPVAYPMPNYFSHPPPPTVYPRMASASYTAPYSHARSAQSQSTGFRMNLQHPRDDFFSAATLRHNGLPLLRAIPAYEDGGDFYDDYVDDHQDMRLDIEDMSYEELLALSEDIGTVKTGLSEETVKDLVKRRTSVTTRINLEEAPPSTDLETDSCTICQENYQNQDKIATLDCKHEYHAECLEKWLVIKNVCPICKSEALKRTE